jgi:hypothetical protein
MLYCLLDHKSDEHFFKVIYTQYLCQLGNLVVSLYYLDEYHPS